MAPSPAVSVTPSHLSNIMDFLIKREDESHQYILNDGWPSNSDELLEDIFGLNGDILDLGTSEVDDLNSFAVGENGNNIAASLAGSDSGLSMDQSDFDMLDQQLSPLMMHQPSSDDDIFNSSFTLQLKNSANSEIPHSPLSSVSPNHSSSSPSDVESSIECSEDKIVIGSCQNNVVKDVQPVQTFQNTINLKRKATIPSATAVVLPKIQKHYISKQEVTPLKGITVSRNDKQKIILNNHNSTISSNIHTVQSADVSSTQKKIIRVAPIAGNQRSILLPLTIKDMKDLRPLKIINATNLKNPANIKIAAANLLQKSKQNMEKKKNSIVYASFDPDEQQYIMEDSTSDRGSVHSEDDDEDRNNDYNQNNRKNGQFQLLELTDEERDMLVKEGISLPSNYPLTRLEERELKRIRRKIRNKISAQDSRRRKKEYVDGLEDRVKQCTEENQVLMKKIKALQSQNHSLATQLKKLQNIVSKGNVSKSTTQPATCLMVLLLSVALVMAPSLRAGNGPSQARLNPNAASIHTPHNALLNSIRRALLSVHTQSSTTNNGVIAMDESSDDVITVDDLSSFGQPLTDHNYPLMEYPISAPGGRFTVPGYMDIPIDEGEASRSPLLKNYPIKLEKIEFDQEFEDNDMQEEVEEIIIDNKDFKDDTTKLYDATMEKFELLESNKFAQISGKLSELLHLTPQALQIDPNAFINIKKNFTKVKNVVMANMELQ